MAENKSEYPPEPTGWTIAELRDENAKLKAELAALRKQVAEGECQQKAWAFVKHENLDLHRDPWGVWVARAPFGRLEGRGDTPLVAVLAAMAAQESKAQTEAAP